MSVILCICIILLSIIYMYRFFHVSCIKREFKRTSTLCMGAEVPPGLSNLSRVRLSDPRRFMKSLLSASIGMTLISKQGTC